MAVHHDTLPQAATGGGAMRLRRLLRLLVGWVGLFNIGLGLAFLLDPRGSAARFFVVPLGTQGLATLRADFTAFFVTGGLFALVAAWRSTRAPLLVPLALLSIAITGRCVSLAVDGAAATAGPPMVVEAMMIAILALAHRSFGPAKAL